MRHALCTMGGCNYCSGTAEQVVVVCGGIQVALDEAHSTHYTLQQQVWQAQIYAIELEAYTNSFSWQRHTGML